MMTSPVEQHNPVFIIQTLGKFDILKDGSSLVSSSAGSKKIWELYKFMLTHRDRVFTPESLMDQLWVSESYSDPRSTLRRQMHRLRQSLLEENEKDNAKTLLFTNGYYKWNDQLNIDIDIENFEQLIKEGDAKKNSTPQFALNDYLEALSLYDGDYLPDCIDQHWVFSIRNHYRRLYLKTVVSATELLKIERRYDDIITLCQKAINIDIYEEAFHLNLMEALMHKNQQKQALEHYEYITGFYYHEMGLKPSVEMRTLYKRLLQTNEPIQSQDSLVEALEHDLIIENAFYCEPDTFKSIYELERRRSQRSGNTFSVGVINATPIRGYSQSQEDLRISHLKQHLMEKLRKGDTFSQWNESQFMVLLPGVDSVLMKRVLTRILDTFPKNEAIVIHQIKELHSDALKAF
ncbi:BTAD domain-containing putative transcriptional regulator [Fusibacter bizertensis]